jgi:hypothetical protein
LHMSVFHRHCVAGLQLFQCVRLRLSVKYLIVHRCESPIAPSSETKVDSIILRNVFILQTDDWIFTESKRHRPRGRRSAPIERVPVSTMSCVNILFECISRNIVGGAILVLITSIIVAAKLARSKAASVAGCAR